MATFIVTFDVMDAITVEVEAETEAQAIELATARVANGEEQPSGDYGWTFMECEREDS